MSDDQVFRANGGVAIAQGTGQPPRWSFGWRESPADVQVVLNTLPFPRFELAAPHLAGSGEGKSAFLWEAAKLVTGGHLPAQQQPRGTCVSRGYSRAIDYLQCVEIALGNEPEEFAFVSHAFIYGCGAEVGHDQNNQDGLVGAWAAKAVATMGNCTNDECGDRDAGYDDLAVQWKAHGVPQKFKQLGIDNLVGDVTLVTKPEQARDMLCNGYPVSVCSGQGFTMTRDAEGRCKPQGSWAHCMMWSGYDDTRRRFCVEQSWGQNTPSGPTILGQPDNSFWIDWDVGARMLREEDSFAVAKFQGWQARKLDWVIQP